MNSITCPNCGYSNPADHKFCGNCGALLPRDATVAHDELLHRLQAYIPEHLLKKIREQGRIEGERRPATVLFADLAGFTALGEGADPETLKTITNECLEAMVRSIYKYEGFVDKFIGDAVMALFGAPVAHEDDPERALRSALEMREAVEAIAIALPAGAKSVNLHIGVHTGEVVLGEVGSDLRLAYTALGDTVNLAARLQQLATSGEILVSGATHRLTEGLFDFEKIEPQTVKGKVEQVVAYRLIAVKPLARSPRGIPGLYSPLVGRDEEIRALTEALAGVSAGRGQIVVITGEPGVGKSRLVAEAGAQFSTLTWLEGRCLSYGGTISFWPFIQMLKEFTGIGEEDADAVAVSKLRLGVRRLFPDRPEEVLPYLGTLLSLRLDERLQERVKYLSGEDLQRRVFLAVRDWLEALAREKPVAAILEDLHWADPSSVSLLEHLMASTDLVPLLLLLVARAEREQPWWHAKVKAETDFPHRTTEISLKPLSEEESNKLVSNLLEVPDFPEGVRKMILEKAEGNPFFVEEVIRGMIDSGVLVRQDGRWRATARIFDVEIPDTVQGVILARIDRLEGEVRQVLQRAAVIGRSFLYRVLVYIAEAEQELDRHLSTLQRRELIREQARLPELEYIFKHVLTQEVAYSTLLHERRKEFHRKVGEAIENLFPGRLEEFYGLLAHHYTQAEDPEKALEYLIKAGDQAKTAYANQEALVYYQQAYDLLKDSKEREEQKKAADLLASLGDLHWILAEAQEALARYEEAKSLYERLGDRGSQAHTIYEISRIYRMGMNDYPKSAEVAQEGLAIAEEIGDPLAIAEGYVGLAGALFWGGIDPIRGKDYVQKARVLFEAAGDPRGLGGVHHLLGLMTDDLDEGLEHSVKAAEYRLQTGDLATAAQSYNNAASYCYLAGNFSQAMMYVQQGIELAEKSGAVGMYCLLHTTLCETLTYLGKWEEAQGIAERNLELARKIGNRQLECFIQGDLGLVAEARGDWREAVEHIRRGVELSKYTSPFYRGLQRQALAEALLQLGQWDEAREYLQEALAIAEEGDSQPLKGMTQRGFANLHTARSAWQEAEEAFQKSLQIWEEVKDPGLERSRTLRDYGLMLLHRHWQWDEKRAREMLREAIAFFRSKDDQFDLIWAERELAELGRTLEDIAGG